MLISGQKPAPSVGQEHRFDAPERAAHHQQRRQHAARGSRPERHRPDDRFHEQDAGDHRIRGTFALQQRADGVVADAERLREDQPAQADDQPADRRPPHPVDRQMLKRVFGGIDRGGQQRRQGSRQQARDDAAEQSFGADEHRMRRDREERTRGR